MTRRTARVSLSVLLPLAVVLFIADEFTDLLVVHAGSFVAGLAVACLAGRLSAPYVARVAGWLNARYVAWEIRHPVEPLPTRYPTGGQMASGAALPPPVDVAPPPPVMITADTNNTGYVAANRSPYLATRVGAHSTRRVQIRPDLLVDITDRGEIAGVKRVGAPVSIRDLMAVLTAVHVDTHQPVGDDRD